jgi:hypothetical protein
LNAKNAVTKNKKTRTIGSIINFLRSSKGCVFGGFVCRASLHKGNGIVQTQPFQKSIERLAHEAPRWALPDVWK